MYDGNPGEIDFGLSKREVRVSDGSSYRESTVLPILKEVSQDRLSLKFSRRSLIARDWYDNSD